jgi:hypothetical protein
MATTWVDFRQITADVAIELVLQRYGGRVRRIGGELRGPCPLPTHTSGRSRDSFSVSVARNVWSCRSQSCMQARGGNPGGNILDLVALMEGCSVRDAALRLQDWRGTMPPRPAVPAEAVRHLVIGLKPDARQLCRATQAFGDPGQARVASTQNAIKVLEHARVATDPKHDLGLR